MSASNEITVTTQSWELWAALHELHIEGIAHVSHYETKLFQGNKERKIVLHIASEVAIGFFVAWLAEKLVSHPESLTKIENQSITHDRSQITNVIMQHVTINNYYGEEQPDDERVTEETP